MGKHVAVTVRENSEKLADGPTGFNKVKLFIRLSTFLFDHI